MAALQKIRNKAGLLIGVIAVALLAFIFPWNELSSFLNKQRDKAFVVNGEVVSTGAYLARVNQFENFQKLISQQTSFDENTTMQIREFVFEQMVKELVLDEQAKNLGFGVSDEEMRDMTVGSNPSPLLRQIPFFSDPQTGQISQAQLNNFLSIVNRNANTISDPQEKAQVLELQDVWATIQNMIKYQRLEEKYNTLLAGAVLVNNIDARTSSDATKATSDIQFVINKYSSIPDSTVTVDKSEIEKLYNLRKNNFRNPQALRTITFFTKEVVPSESDFQAVEREIGIAREKLANAVHPALVVADYSDGTFQDVFFSEKQLSPSEAEFVRNASIGDIDGPIRDGDAFRLYKLVDKVSAPDSVRLRMIVLPEGTDRTTAHNQADSIINVIRQGKDFATVANEIYPQANGGEIGWVTEAQMASLGREFIDASFKAPIGEITKLNLQGQIQILKVEERTKPVNKYKIALIHMPVVVSDQTLAGIDNEINEFVANNSDGKNFAQAAEAKGYNLISNQRIYPAQFGINSIPGSRQVISWAFNEKVGSVKKFDLNDYKIVAMIDSKIDAGFLPLSEVSDVLKAEIIRDKKAEKMITDLKTKNLNSLDGFADAMNSKIDTVKFVTFNTPNIMGIGRESALNAFAEAGQVGKLEGPIKGDNGVIALNLINKVEADKENFDYDTARQTLSSQNMYRVMTQAMYVLKDKMNVLDNRIILF